jgi:hypothetical protein
MSPKRLGDALYDLGWYASGGTLFFLLVCGGGQLWFSAADNPFLTVVAWGMVVVLGGGLLCAAAGYVLREASDEPTSPGADLEKRVKYLEAEVARLRALLALPVNPGDLMPPGAAPGDARITDAPTRS